MMKIRQIQTETNTNGDKYKWSGASAGKYFVLYRLWAEFLNEYGIEHATIELQLKDFEWYIFGGRWSKKVYLGHRKNKKNTSCTANAGLGTRKVKGTTEKLHKLDESLEVEGTEITVKTSVGIMENVEKKKDYIQKF